MIVIKLNKVTHQRSNTFRFFLNKDLQCTTNRLVKSANDYFGKSSPYKIKEPPKHPYLKFTFFFVYLGTRTNPQEVRLKPRNVPMTRKLELKVPPGNIRKRSSSADRGNSEYL